MQKILKKLGKKFLAISCALAFGCSLMAGGIALSKKSTQAWAATIGQKFDRVVPEGATEVSTPQAMVEALKNNQDVSLTSNLTLSGEYAFSTNLFNDTTQTGYTGSFYGNGYTITINGRDGSGETTTDDKKPFTEAGNTADFAYGGIVGVLNGAVYDVNIVINNRVAFGPKANSYDIFLGGVAGQMNAGSVIDNCSVTINQSSELFAFNWGGNTNGYNATGGIAGRMIGGATLKNCAVTNNGVIKAGQGEGAENDVASSNLTSQEGSAGNIVGYIENSTPSTIDNIITRGSGKVYAFFSSNIGMNYPKNNHSSGVTINNFYTSFSGTYEYGSLDGGMFQDDTNCISSRIFRFWGDGSRIVNFIHSSGYNSQNSNKSEYVADVTSQATIDENGFSLSFDPSSSDASTSLVITVPSESAPQGAELVTLTHGSCVHYGQVEDDGSVTFAGMPTSADHYGSNFAPVFEGISITKEAALGKYDAGYVAADYQPSGEEISTSAELSALIAQNGAGYLTDDIVLTSFSAATFSGTLDGNGHTIYIANVGNSAAPSTYGGIVGTLSGIIKNLRVVAAGDVNVATSADGSTMQTGLVCGKMIDGAALENVQVKVQQGKTFSAISDGTIDMGGAVGLIDSASVSLSDVTVDIAGVVASKGEYAFTSAVVGTNQGYDGQTLNFKNIIIKGSGKLQADGTNGYEDHREDGFIGALIILRRPSDENEQRSDVNVSGLINAYSGQVVCSTGTLSMYGVIAVNDSTNAWGGTNSQVVVNGYASLGSVTAEQQMQNGHQNNSFVKMTPYSLTAADGVSFEPYFDGQSMILTSSSTGDYDGLQVILDQTPYFAEQDDSQQKISLPNNFAQPVESGSLTVEPYYIGANPTLTTTKVTYSGSEQGATISVDGKYDIAYKTKEGSTNAQLGQSGLPLTAGEYQATVTLTENNKYFSSESNLTKTFDFDFSIDKKSANVSVSLNEGASITYGDSAEVVEKLVSATSQDFVGEVTYTVALNVTDGQYTASTAAGTTVTFVVSATAADGNENYDITVSAQPTLTVQKNVVTIAENKQKLEENYGTITNSSNFQTILGDLIEREAGTETASYTASVVEPKYSTDGNLNIGSYSITITLTDKNYTFAQADSTTISLTIKDAAPSEITISSAEYGNQNYSKTALEDYLIELLREGQYGIMDRVLTLAVDEEGSYWSGADFLKQGSNQFTLTLNDTQKKVTIYVPVSQKTIKLSLTEESITKTYDAEAGALPSLNPAICEGDSAMATLSTEGDRINAGSYPISLTVSGEDSGNYSITLDKAYNYVVEKADLKLVSSQDEAVYGSVTKENWQTFLSDKVTLKGCGEDEFTPDLSSTQISAITGLLPAGKYAIQVVYNFEEEGNYNNFSGSFDFTVDKSEVTIPEKIDGLVYGNENATAEKWKSYLESLKLVSGIGDEKPGYTISCTALDNTQGLIGAGSYTITISVSGLENYNDKTATAEWKIDKANVTVESLSDEQASHTYGTLETSKLCSYIESLKLVSGVSGEKPNYSASCSQLESIENQYLPVGEYQIKITFAGSDNYNATDEQTVTLKVNKKSANVSVSLNEGASITYGDSAEVVEKLVSATSQDFVGEVTYTVELKLENGQYTASTAAGTTVTFVVSASAADGNGNYDITVSAQPTLTVQKKVVSLTSPITKLYGDVSKQSQLASILGDVITGEAGTETASYTATLTAEEADWSQTGLLKVGSYTVTVTLPEGNYIFAEQSQTATLTLQISGQLSKDEVSAQKEYGAVSKSNLSEVLAKILLENLPEIGDRTFTFNTQNAEFSTGEYLKSGQYHFVATMQDDQNVTVTLTLDIQKMAITLSLTESSITKTYDAMAGALPSLSPAICEGDNVEATLSTEGDRINAGSYPISLAVSGEDSGNYSITLDKAYSYVVEKADLKLVSSQDKAVYGSVTNENWKTFLSGKVTLKGCGEDEFTPDLSSTQISAVTGLLPAGKYAIQVAYNFVEQGNYNNFSGSIDFTVDKKSATVTITLKEDASGITYGTNAEEVKTYVSKVEFSGFAVEGQTYTIVLKVGEQDYTQTTPIGSKVTFLAEVTTPDGVENYVITQNQPALYVQKRQIELDMTSATLTYGSQEASKEGLEEYIQSLKLAGDIPFELEIDQTIFDEDGFAKVNASGHRITLKNDNCDFVGGAFANEFMLIITQTNANVKQSLSFVYGEEGLTEAEVASFLQGQAIVTDVKGRVLDYTVSVDQIKVSRSTRIAAGQYSVQVSFEGNENYYSLEKTIQMTISKLQVELDLQESQVQFTGQEITPVLEGLDKILDGDDISISLKSTPAKILQTGKYDLSILVEGQDRDNYQISLLTSQFEVTKATADVSLDQQIENATVEEDENQIVVKISLSTDLMFAGQWLQENIVQTLQNLDILVSSSGEKLAYAVQEEQVLFTQGGRLKAGQAIFAVELLENNYLLTKPVKIEISTPKVAVSVSFEDASYNGRAQMPEAVYRVFENDDVKITLAMGGEEAIDAGEYNVDMKVDGADSQDYTFTLEKYTFTIAPRQLHIDLDKNQLSFDQVLSLGSEEGQFDPLDNVLVIMDQNYVIVENVALEYVIEEYDETVGFEAGKTYTVTITLAQSETNNQAKPVSYTFVMAPQEQEEQSGEKQPTNLALIIGLAAGGAVLIAAIVLTIVLVKKKHSKKSKDDGKPKIPEEY